VAALQTALRGATIAGSAVVGLSSGGTAVDVSPLPPPPTPPAPPESDGMDLGTVIILIAVIMISVVGGVVVCVVFICVHGGSGQSEDGKNTTKNPVADMDIADEVLEQE
jgi:hypothetical protein